MDDTNEHEDLFVKLSEVSGWKIDAFGISVGSENPILVHTNCGYTKELEEGPDQLLPNVIVAILNDDHECAN